MLTVKKGAKVILRGTLSSNLAWFGGPLVTSYALVRHYFVFKNLSNLEFSKFKKFKNLKNFIIIFYYKDNLFKLLLYSFQTVLKKLFIRAPKPSNSPLILMKITTKTSTVNTAIAY